MVKNENVLLDPNCEALCPPTPLTENHFAKKPLAERGVPPPPPKKKLPKNFLKKWEKIR